MARGYPALGVGAVVDEAHLGEAVEDFPGNVGGYPPLGEVALDPIDEEQERERARRLALSRYPQVSGLPYPTQARRLIGALTRRGYDLATASAVVREVLAEEAGGAD
ncbi:MAG: hypothetical protein ACKOT0_00890 [bacterium]